MEEQIREIMGDVLKIDPAGIGDETSMDTVASWDSLAHITILGAIEEEFGIVFEVEEMEAMLSYPDLMEILSTKL